MAEKYGGVSGILEQLGEAILDCTRELRDTNRDQADRLDTLSMLSDLHLARFGLLNALEDVEKPIDYLSQAVLIAPDGHAKKRGWLYKLGTSLQRRFEKVGELADIDRAIQHLSDAVSLTPGGHADKSEWLSKLGIAHQYRFDRLGKLTDIDQAIACHSEAISLTSDGHASQPGMLNNLGSSYQRRFEHLGELTDIEQAIACQSQAASLTPDGHAHKPGRLNNLESSYQRRFERLGELSDLERAIAYLSETVSLTPHGHVYRPGRLNNLGNSYQRRFERLDELPDLERAIECLAEAASLAPGGHADKYTALNNLGSSYECRFERLGELADIDRAIACHLEALSLVPDGHIDKSGVLDNLGISHRCRFERLGELPDIDQAIAYQSEAVSLIPDGHAHKSGRLNNLGSSYQRRFERLSELTDLERAITCNSEAVSLTPDRHPEKPKWLNNLGNSLQSRFDRLGELADINHAITYKLEAVLTTPDGHTDKLTMLSSLGVAHQCRFYSLRDLSDVNRAIEYQSKAVSLTPGEHAGKPAMLSRLSLSLQLRFDRLGELVDIERAISCLSEAVSLTPDGHADKPRVLNQIGSALQCLFERFGELADIDRAIACQSKAVSLSPDGNENNINSLNNLGISQLCRFRRLGQLTDMDSAISNLSEAVSLTSDGHPDKPGRLSNLGSSYRRRFDRLGELTDADKSISLFQMAAQSLVGSSNIRLGASMNWARVASLIHHSTCLSAYHRAMQLIPQAIWIGNTIHTRYDDIDSVGIVAVEAAAAAIASTEYGTALEWLEAGRSIVWNQTLQLRTEFDDLALIAPDLANELKQVAQELEVASQRDTTMMADSHTLEAIAQRHHFLAAQYEKLLASTRKLPGFQGFMQSKKVTELVLAAQSGPVVMINVHATGCDALILRPNCQDVAHVPLPGLTQDHTAKLHRQMHQLLTSGRAGQRRPILEKPPSAQFESVLAALWYAIANPVLSYLGYLEKSSTEPLPHITWCTTGALSFLPIHAAGCYVPGGQKIFDFAISSYSPTLGALLSARSGSSQIGGILVVGQEATPGCQPLAGTKPELAHIQQHTRAIPHKLLEGDQATVEAVIKDMEEYSSVHLACHGSQIIRDPTSSCFHLHDGSLSLAAIAKKSFKNKGLAFLSACETAAGDEKMPDEAVHLAAGMLAAGYPTVIATMWSIDDGDAPVVADLVYGELMKDGKLGNGQAARALHKAVKALRERAGENQFSRWVPYIHIGV